MGKLNQWLNPGIRALINDATSKKCIKSASTWNAAQKVDDILSPYHQMTRATASGSAPWLASP
jgi:hypothetical protein